MQRSVYLQGELGEKFGHKFNVHASSCAEILKCINANRPNFKEYLRQCEKDEIALAIKVQEEPINEEGLIIPLKEGDVYISLIPAGSKDGVGKILASIALVTIALPMLGASALPNMTIAQAQAITAQSAYGVALQAGAQTLAGKMAIGLAANLALTGIAEVMAPDPEQDVNSQNYLFDGDTQLIEEGDPVPVLYGELRVPGRPIEINVINGSYTNPTSILEADGSISTYNVETTEPAGE